MKLISKWVLGLSLVVAVLRPSMAQNSSSSRNSDIIAVALPTYALAVSYMKADERGLVQLVQSEAATLAIVEVLKAGAHRTRPDGSDNKSFPSGHAAVAFSAAQYLQMKGDWEYGVPAYALASYVAYARVDAKKHHWSDVVAGGAIGALTTYRFTDSAADNRLSVSWVPGAAALVWQRPLK